MAKKIGSKKIADKKKKSPLKGSKGRASSKNDSYHHGDLKSSLIESALKLIKLKGPENLSLRELARAAGVSQAAPYRHFKNKNELLAAISEQGFELKFQYMMQAIRDSKGDAKKMYFDTGLAYFRMGLKHPQHFKLMTSSEVTPSEEYPSLLMTAAKTFMLLKELLEYGQRAGVIGAGDPFHKALNCWCIVNGFTSLYAEGRLELIGVNAQNAESALKTLISQNLIGSQKPLSQSQFGFSPFNTPESSLVKKMFLEQPSSEITELFETFKK